MQPQILNVDILDDKQPFVFVQKYIYPDRTFQVFRKSTSPDEEFELSPGVEIDPDLFWGVGVILFNTPDELDDDMDELFALVYLDEENPPLYDPELQNQVDPHVMVAYSAGERRYYCEPTIVDYDGIEDISAPTLDEAITRAVDGLHTALALAGSNE